MERKIFLSLLMTGVVSVLLTAVVALTALFIFIENRVYNELQSDADLIIAALDSTEGMTLFDNIDEVDRCRITLISPEGQVLYDNYANVDGLGSHLNRPEIIGALEKGSSYGRHSSETFGEILYYYAIRLDDGNILRVSLSSDQSFTIFLGTAIMTLLISGGLIAVGIFLSSRLTMKITAPVRRLAANIGDDTLDEADNDIYPEFKPLVDKIRRQQLEIKHQLARVEKEKNRLATIINNMDEGLLLLDNSFNIIMLNESACRLLGSRLSRFECTGKPIAEVCPLDEVKSCIENADSINLTINGRHLQLHVNQVMASAEEVGRIGLILDITERSEIERIKQEFTANVSHELKTPLTSISGYAELIESGMATGDDIILFAGRIRRESARMLTLISDIIKLSQLDEESNHENFEPVDLHTICEECMDILDISAKRHNVSLSLEGETCELLASPSELTELVYNLIDNAIRYNRPGGKVSIKVESGMSGYPEGTVMLTVSDTGIGIAKEHTGRVFERFYRVDKSRSKATGGTGLGLAIVKHVAERHGAKLTLDSELNVGTTVRVIFYGNVSENP
ncbi:MAG TPA: PAS domain S-box protein [Firmicutes bacterium]|nr:PAS domain S-box protein [Bacillota bacterium]